jgi:hypothetical protein
VPPSQLKYEAKEYIRSTRQRIEEELDRLESEGVGNLEAEERQKRIYRSWADFRDRLKDRVRNDRTMSSGHRKLLLDMLSEDNNRLPISQKSTAAQLSTFVKNLQKRLNRYGDEFEQFDRELATASNSPIKINQDRIKELKREKKELLQIYYRAERDLSTPNPKGGVNVGKIRKTLEGVPHPIELQDSGLSMRRRALFTKLGQIEGKSYGWSITQGLRGAKGLSKVFPAVGTALSTGVAVASGAPEEALPGEVLGCGEIYGPYESIGEGCRRKYEWNDSTLRFLSMEFSEQMQQVRDFPGMCQLVMELHEKSLGGFWNVKCSESEQVLLTSKDGKTKAYLSLDEGNLTSARLESQRQRRFSSEYPASGEVYFSNQETQLVKARPTASSRGNRGAKQISLSAREADKAGETHPAGSLLAFTQWHSPAFIEVASCCSGEEDPGVCGSYGIGPSQSGGGAPSSSNRGNR